MVGTKGRAWPLQPDGPGSGLYVALGSQAGHPSASVFPSQSCQSSVEATGTSSRWLWAGASSSWMATAAESSWSSHLLPSTVPQVQAPSVYSDTNAGDSGLALWSWVWRFCALGWGELQLIQAVSPLAAGLGEAGRRGRCRGWWRGAGAWGESWPVGPSWPLHSICWTRAGWGPWGSGPGTMPCCWWSRGCSGCSQCCGWCCCSRWRPGQPPSPQAPSCQGDACGSR